MIRPLSEIKKLILEAKENNFKLLISGTEFVEFYEKLNVIDFKVSYCCLNDKLKNEEFILCTF